MLWRLVPLLNASRPRRPTEVAAVAAIQAQAFHKPSAFAPLDTLLYYTFQVRRSKPFGYLVPHLRGGGKAGLWKAVHCTKQVLHRASLHLLPSLSLCSFGASLRTSLANDAGVLGPVNIFNKMSRPYAPERQRSTLGRRARCWRGYSRN